MPAFHIIVGLEVFITFIKQSYSTTVSLDELYSLTPLIGLMKKMLTSFSLIIENDVSE